MGISYYLVIRLNLFSLFFFFPSLTNKGVENKGGGRKGGLCFTSFFLKTLKEAGKPES